MSELGAGPVDPDAPRVVIDAAHLAHQREWSEATFGPGPRTLGVLDHIRKELREIEDDPDDLGEWVDVIILAFDGAWRAGWEPQEIIDAVKAKQARNEAREWPDWRTMSADRAIEHVRSHPFRGDVTAFGCMDCGRPERSDVHLLPGGADPMSAHDVPAHGGYPAAAALAAGSPSAPPAEWELGWMAAAEAYATRLGLYCADATCGAEWFALHPDGHWFFPATVGGGEHGHTPKMPDAPTVALREWIANEEVAALRDGLTVIADAIDAQFLAAAAGSPSPTPPNDGEWADALSDLASLLPPERWHLMRPPTRALLAGSLGVPAVVSPPCAMCERLRSERDALAEELMADLPPEHPDGLRCPKCRSTDVTCDGRMHRCGACGYDGTTPTAAASPPSEAPQEGEWEREDLGRGHHRMKRDLGGGVQLLAASQGAGSAVWVAWEPPDGSPAIEVGTADSIEEAMQKADAWAGSSASGTPRTEEGR